MSIIVWVLFVETNIEKVLRYYYFHLSKSRDTRSAEQFLKAAELKKIITDYAPEYTSILSNIKDNYELTPPPREIQGYIYIQTSGKQVESPPRTPLRTQRASFPALSSSHHSLSLTLDKPATEAKLTLLLRCVIVPLHSLYTPCSSSP